MSWCRCSQLWQPRLRRVAQGSGPRQVWSLTLLIFCKFFTIELQYGKGDVCALPDIWFTKKPNIESCVSGQTCTERALLIVLMASKRSYWNLMRSNSVGEALPAADWRDDCTPLSSCSSNSKSLTKSGVSVKEYHVNGKSWNLDHDISTIWNKLLVTNISKNF